MSSGPLAAAPPLVSPAWLRARSADARVRVLDARWYLAGKRGADEYAAGHLPGAVFVNLDADLSSPRGQGPGRHPLPTPDAFARVLARAGIGATTHVVAYDDAGGAIAARVWWLMRYFGLASASVLDGGIAAWLAEGGALTTDVPAIVPAPMLRLTPRPALVADKRAVDRLRATPSAVVLDARSADRFEGKSEPVDARPGHIPGARSMPFAGNLAAPGGRFLDREALSARYDGAGVRSADTIVCYCGSGVTACHDLLALALLGRPDALLYEGSWSDWAADPALPAALGPA
ncbi:MAG: sulfurtransferase [Polyangiaceae bacterium]